MFKVFKRSFNIRKTSIWVVIKQGYAKSMSQIKDNSLDTFRRICDEIASESSYLKKASILQDFFKKGSSGKGFEGDTLVWVQLLIPGASQRVYNLQNKQMLKLFARVFHLDVHAMQLDLEQEGDISETLCKFFENSKKLKPQAQSSLYLQDVEEFLADLEQRTKEDEQTELLQHLCQRTTATDLKMVIRLIKQDLRINARARHILDAFGPLAYPAYQASRDLPGVVKQYAATISSSNSPPQNKVGKKEQAQVGSVQVMTPISPMLANACKSVEEAFKKSPGGLYSEVKYDGERVQIHKQGQEFKFFSRNLRPVMDHKIKRFKDFIPRAFPGGGNMILDSEIILVDTVNGELMPFGTLGAHKKKQYAKAEVCLFVFDCILYNGDDLTTLTFRERREILEKNIVPIKSYVQLSESHFLKTKKELSIMTAKVLKANLEGVVLKSPEGTYQPGKRGWLKVKKDYLFGGKMADTADLVVLGAWFGSGKKGGILSIFLMGCYDPTDRLWKTVTKVHSGLDDATNEKVHEQLLALMDRADANKLPLWLLCKKSLVPDFIAKTPNRMPVWEITGAEFTKSEAHTAGGISIRFPRITKIRNDKSAIQGNDLKYLQKLYDASKNDVNVDLLLADCNDVDAIEIDSKVSETPGKKGINGVKKMKRESPSSDENTVQPAQTVVKDVSSSEKPVKKKLLIDFFKPNTKIKESIVKMETDVNCKESNLFKNYVAHFSVIVATESNLALFKHNGGTVASQAEKANIAFHVTGKEINLKELRKSYKPSCRHIQVDWLRDSLAGNACLPFSLYAVVLH